MMTLTQTMTLMYTKTPNLTSIQRLSLCTGLIINGRGWVGNDRGNCPGGTSRGSKVLGYLGDVRDKCPDTVAEWHKRNLVTLARIYPGRIIPGLFIGLKRPRLQVYYTRYT